MRILLLFSLVFLSIQGQAQYSEWLNSDRGGEGNGPFTVGKNTLQIEAGWAYTDQVRKFPNPETASEKFRTNQYTDNRYETRFRLGITEIFEASAGISYLFAKKKSYDLPLTNKDDFIEQLDVAVRGNLYKGNGAIPAVGLELQVAYVMEDPSRKDIIMNAVFAFKSSFTEKFSLLANVGTGDDLLLTLSASYQFTDRFSAFAEYNPQFSGDYFLSEDYFEFAQAFANTGVAYYISRDFQLDMSSTFLLHQAGIEKGYDISDYFGFQVGFTGRMNWRH